jgi:SAM-dependent methyltransferase
MSAGDRLQPSPGAANYIHLRALRAQLARRIEEHLAGRRDLHVLDVGCGERPYEPLFSGRCVQYVGLDTRPGPGVDVVGEAEELPFGDGDFDCVLCTQVLQYLRHPAAAIREFHRVLRPHGCALVSAHGVSNAHCEPPDYWRWTHLGLERVFRDAGRWATLDVFPNGGTASGIAYLSGRQLEALGARAGATPLLRPLLFGLNVLAWNVDRRYRRLAPHRPPDLAPSYLVVAVRDE